MNDLRDLIFAKSVEIIAEKGVRGLSFREVARRANVSHQAPYHYFKNDSEILSAIARDGFLKLSAGMREAASKQANDPLGALKASGVFYAIFAINHPGHFRVMFQRTLLPQGTPIAALPEAQETLSLHNTLAKAAHDTGIASSISLDKFSLLCWSTSHGIASLVLEGLGGIDASSTMNAKEQVAAQVVESLSTLLKMDVK